MVNNRKFLTKFPISIREKQHSKINNINGNIKHFKDKVSRRFKSQYGYFAIDKKNNVNFQIVLVDKKEKKNYTIKIAKSHIYDSLLLFLQYRPIERKPKRNKEFYIHNSNKLHNVKDDFDKLTPPEMMMRYYKALDGIESIIENNSNDVRKRTAQLQFERLLEQQWKMKLLYEIYQSEQLINEEKN